MHEGSDIGFKYNFIKQLLVFHLLDIVFTSFPAPSLLGEHIHLKVRNKPQLNTTVSTTICRTMFIK